jgi:hypothetical protein
LGNIEVNSIVQEVKMGIISRVPGRSLFRHPLALAARIPGTHYEKAHYVP